MSASSLERRQRIREQLREFYGDPNASSEQRHVDSGGRADGVSPELDLDSEFFNVQKYTTDLLRRESLKGLVETDTQLLRTVRQLDGELQELVYRNYAKFISATDTIREMRDNINEMDSKLHALSSNVENIDRVSNGVSEKLQTHRSHIEEMISTNRMLRKVQFLVDLPATLRRLIERRDYSACVKYWVLGDGFLVKHAGLPSIAKIHDECRSSAQQLYNMLRDTVLSASLDDPEAMDVIRCVLEDMRLMRATSLFPHEEEEAVVSASAADTAEANVKARAKRNHKAALSSFETDMLNSLLKNVTANFAAGIQDVKSAMKCALSVPTFTAIDPVRRLDALQHVSLQEPLAQLKSVCALFYSYNQRVYMLFNHENDVVLPLRIVEEVQPVLIDIMTPISTHMSELLIAVVDAAVNEDDLSPQKHSEGVGSGVDMIFLSFAKLLKCYAYTLKTLGDNYLDNAHSNQSRHYAVLVDQLVVEIFQRLLNALEAKVTEGLNTSIKISCHDSVTSAAYQQLFRFSMTRFLLSSAATTLGTTGIAALITMDILKPTDVVELQKRCARVAQALVNRGIVLLGQLHLNWVATACCPVDAVDPLSSAALHSGLHPCLHKFVEQLGMIYVFLQKRGIFYDGSGNDKSSGRGRRSMENVQGGSALLYTSTESGRSSGLARETNLTITFTRQNDDALQSSVERIFSRQSHSSTVLHTSPRKLSASNVVAGVVVYFLKGLVEYVRQRVFTRQGLQCVQISCTFLLHALTLSAASDCRISWSSVEEWLRDSGDDALLKMRRHLLNECCTCVYERCVDRVPLTAVVVEKLVKSALEEASRET